MSVKKIVLLFIIAIPFLGIATESHSEEKKFEPTDIINSHIGDSHEFHIADWNGHPISLPLPIILWTKNGLVYFLSSEFHHNNSGERIVEKNGQKFVRENEIIYYADKHKSLSQDEKGAFNFQARPLNFSITKQVFLFPFFPYYVPLFCS